MSEHATPRRLGKMISHLRWEDLPAEVLLELVRPRRLGKMSTSSGRGKRLGREAEGGS